MDKRELTIDYAVCHGAYPEKYDSLCRRAVEASRRAYCVYSGFAVGAAVLLDNGVIVEGSNQENAAYPSGLCAERTALFYASSEYPQAKVIALAVVSAREGMVTERYVTPCGACRQVMAEMIGKSGCDFDVVLVGKLECLLIKASALLPFAFELEA